MSGPSSTPSPSALKLARGHLVGGRSLAPLLMTGRGEAYVLARRSDRLRAHLIDRIALFSVLAFGIWITSLAVSFLGSAWLAATLGAIPVAVFTGLQVGLLATEGQTIGKRAMGLRIVDAKSGRAPGWVRTVLMRSLVTELLLAPVMWMVMFMFPASPFLAALSIPLVDVLGIARKDRRCMHDLIADTWVVRRKLAAPPEVRAALPSAEST